MPITISGTQITFNDSSVQTSSAKIRAFVNFDGTVATPTIRSSFNVTSVTRSSQGIYIINLTAGALSDANYTMHVSAGGNSFMLSSVPQQFAAAPTTSSFPIYLLNGNATLQDFTYVSVAVCR
jgi:hypothetical protein